MFKTVRGTKDILPQEAAIWQKVENITREVFDLFGYEEIRIPIIEYKDLFLRSLGQENEIVQKQMFLVEREKEAYALRPEGTASVARSYIENNLANTKGFSKLFYIGPMFRAERPQKGRLRQFHHLGIEAIGSKSAYLDAEVIQLADFLLRKLGIDNFQINLNSLGCKKDKEKLASIIKEQLKDKLSDLCQDCNRRYEQNVFRILDCKNPDCIKIKKSLNIKQQDYLCTDCLNYFHETLKALDRENIKYNVDNFLVRGLDYYTGLVFEISQDDLGAQDVIGAGGRYDNLIEELGGKSVPAIGFAFGLERVLIALKNKNFSSSQMGVYVIFLDDNSRDKENTLICELRKHDIKCDTDFVGKSLKAALRKANDSGFRFVLLLGGDEIKNNTVTVKDMQQKSQVAVERKNIFSYLKGLIK